MQAWNTFLGEIKDNQTLENLCIASLSFREMLSAERVHFLFPKVLGLLALDYLDAGTLIEPSAGPEEEEMQPRTSSTILTLRKVCKSWMAGVDSFLEYQSGFEQEKTLQIKMDHQYAFSSGDATVVPSFIRHFQSSHSVMARSRNPFLGRAISLNVMGGNMKLLLETYGHHVHYLNLTISSSCTTQLSYKLLRQVLDNVPNLKLLQLNWAQGLRTEYGVPKLEKSIEADPLPNLEHLQGLRLIDVPGILNHHLLRQNSHILYLEVLPPIGLLALSSLQLPNLTCLKLTISSLFELENLPESIPSTPKLTALQIDAGFSVGDGDGDYGDTSVQSLGRCFQKVNNWPLGHSLTEVTVLLPEVVPYPTRNTILREGADLRLELANVEIFTVFLGCPCPLDFLLPMKDSLKELCVEIGWWSTGEKRLTDRKKMEDSIRVGMGMQQVQFLGWELKLLESNIWEVFPKLREVVIEGPLKIISLEYENYGVEELNEKNVMQYRRPEWKLKRKEIAD